MSASVELLKDEKTDPELLSVILTGVRTLFTHFYSVVPSVPSVLEAVSDKIHHWIKKKKTMNPSRCLLLQFLRGVFSDKQFFVACLCTWSNVGDPSTCHS